MLINSIQFILFIIILLLIYKIMPKKYKWTVLLIASYIFYFLNSSKLIAFILVSTISIYFVAMKMQKIDEKAKIQAKNIEDKEEKKKLKNKAKKKKKIVLAVGIIFNLAILVFLKYSGFIAGSLNTILHINLPIFKFILPLGISYYTLQAISYIVDVYRGKVEADKNIARVALFVAYFPQLVQGPIGRYDELANQLYNPHEITFKNLTYGSELMLWG